MPDPRPDNEPIRQAAVKLMRRGVVSPADLVPLVGMSRQAIHQWAVQAKVDLTKARARWVKQCWERGKR
jgi:hypothetical protein